jgi:hypothetical protein
MQTEDLERIRFVTRHYGGLRGLYLVSMGLMFLSRGLLRTLSGDFKFLLVFGLFVGALALWIFARAYYYRTFGEVEPRKGSKIFVRLAVFLGAILGVLLGVTILFTAAGAELNEARLFYTLWGALFIGAWIDRECRRSQSYYLVIGALLLALAAPGPVAGFLFPGLANQGVGELCSGSAVILAGLLDHWQLVLLLGASAAASQPA